MLNPEDRDAIEGLFERIDNVARAGGPRDVEAETLIASKLREAPAAPYYMAQTLLVQEHALRVAEQRIAELEANLARRPSGGGIFGGLFGGDNEPESERQPVRRAGRGPWDRQDNYEDRVGRGGGFLAGAAQTALGVTGGVLLGSALAGMLTGDAQAQEHNADQPEDEPQEDIGSDDDNGGDFDMGGDF